MVVARVETPGTLGSLSMLVGKTNWLFESSVSTKKNCIRSITITITTVQQG